VTPAERWVRERLDDAPPELLDTMLAWLPPAERSASVADDLAAAAHAAYAELLARGTGGREDALPLLAADALLTHALQAQAEDDPDGIGALVERWGAAGALGRLAEQAPPAVSAIDRP
jgi:hypothetical protein